MRRKFCHAMFIIQNVTWSVVYYCNYFYVLDISFQWRIQDFPLGGRALTSDADAYWQKCMQKQKNPVGEGGAGGAPGSANAFYEE